MHLNSLDTLFPFQNFPSILNTLLPSSNLLITSSSHASSELIIIPRYYPHHPHFFLYFSRTSYHNSDSLLTHHVVPNHLHTTGQVISRFLPLLKILILFSNPIFTLFIISSIEIPPGHDPLSSPFTFIQAELLIYIHFIPTFASYHFIVPISYISILIILLSH